MVASMLFCLAFVFGTGPENTGDASLRGVCFVDASEGWAVGEEGVILHTIDGGQTWEKQSSATRGTLEAVAFPNPYEGWVVGHDDKLPQDACGVVLYTKDGGISWKRILGGEVPALFSTQFEGKNGWIVGKANHRFPGGVIQTLDGGLTWKPGSGVPIKGWLASAKNPGSKNLALGGLLGMIGRLGEAEFVVRNVDPNVRRSVRSMASGSAGMIAVGEQGLALRQTIAGGEKWEPITGLFSNEANLVVDLLAVNIRGNGAWLAGRPGSFVARSEDGGRSWRKIFTGQNAPIRGLFFVSEKQGYAVGDRGTILGTRDGGETWKSLRSGGQRAGVLVMGPDREHLNKAMIAQVGWVDGIHVDSWVASQALPGDVDFQAGNDSYLHLRELGATGFSVGLTWSGHREEPGYSRMEWAQRVAERMGGDAVDRLTRSLVLTLRSSQPESVVVEWAGLDPNHHGLSIFLREALINALSAASDSSQYPEQIREFGLLPWKVNEVLLSSGATSPIRIDLMEIRPRLNESLRDFTVGICPEEGPRLARGGELFFKHDLMIRERTGRGLRGAWNELVDPVRIRAISRPPVPVEDLDSAQMRAIRRKNQVMQLLGTGDFTLAEPDKLASNLDVMLKGVEDDAGARVHLALARIAREKGNWNLARELYTRFLDKYPANTGVIEAATWVIVHNSSGEARRRHELRQVLREGILQFETASSGKSENEGGFASMGAGGAAPSSPRNGTRDPKAALARAIYETPAANTFALPVPKTPQTLEKVTLQTSFVDNVIEAKKWYQDAVNAGGKMAAFGSMVSDDPRIRFAWLSASRKLGEHNSTRDFCEEMSKSTVGAVDPEVQAWRKAAAMELWLSNRKGNSPMPAWACRKSEGKPWLDGNLDEPFWSQIPGQHPLAGKNSKSTTLFKEAGTQKRFSEPVALFAHDDNFLYVGIRVKSPNPEASNLHDLPTTGNPLRGHDRDLSRLEHLNLIIDIDRDYSSVYRFRIDPRGWIDDLCWEDTTWDPRWFVASRRSGDWWEVELAIPLSMVSSEKISHGKAWAIGISHHSPFQAPLQDGDISWSGSGRVAPAQPSPNDFGILMFQSPNLSRTPPDNSKNRNPETKGSSATNPPEGSRPGPSQ